jgi:hypothetical protein
MIELKETLQNSLIENSSLSVYIDCHVPKLTMRINDSRQMILYGIGLDKQHGFTLNVSIDKNSNMGKRISQLLNSKGMLNEFKVFEDKRSLIYVKDFGSKVTEISETIDKIFEELSSYNLGKPYEFTVNKMDTYHRLE